jgi:pimeloyl-ACP methyl ester carboxylesterase
MLMALLCAAASSSALARSATAAFGQVAERFAHYVEVEDAGSPSPNSRRMWKMALLALAAVAAVETPQPDNSGRLADRQFAVAAPRGSGIARYFGSASLDGSDATQAVIVVHGVLRDADYYFDSATRAVAMGRARHTIVIAPQFVEASDLAGHNVPKNTLFWPPTWPGGSDARNAAVSTYDVFDAMLARLSDLRRFPNMRRITIIGHSAGGQIVQRYAVVGHAAQLDRSGRVAVHLVVANPSSYLYFGDWRPVPQTNCVDFDRWRYGLAGAPAYVSGTTAMLQGRYAARRVTYLLGTADTNPIEDDLDRTCGGEAQGPYRFARGKYYIGYLVKLYPQGSNQDYAFVRGVPHDNRRMFTSQCGLDVLFGGSESSCERHGWIGPRLILQTSDRRPGTR